jgi:hypothetical protein
MLGRRNPRPPHKSQPAEAIPKIAGPNSTLQNSGIAVARLPKPAKWIREDKNEIPE